MRKIALQILLASTIFKLHAQDSVTIYLDKMQYIVDKENSYSYRVIKKVQANIFDVKEYYNTDTLRLTYQYKSKKDIVITNDNYVLLLKKNRIKIDGNLIEYREDGSLKAISHYRNGNLRGLPERYYKPDSNLHADDIYFIVEEMPAFQGGDEMTFRNWVQQNLIYPEKAFKDGACGRVFVQFAVGADGIVKNVKIVRGVTPELDAEVERVVSSSPKWTPGTQKGKAVTVQFTMPIVFVLQ